jgi:hypothetical protein
LRRNEVAKVAATTDTRTMGWPRKPRTINEELRKAVARDEQPVSAERQPAESPLLRFGVGLVAALAVVAAKLGVAHLPTFIGLAVGAVVVSHYFSVFARSTSRKAPGRGRILRAFLLGWLSICVVATAFVALGGFQLEDRAILGIVWPVLVLFWVVYRLRVAAANPRSETGGGVASGSRIDRSSP